MTRPSDGEIVAMLGMPTAEMPAAISEIAEMERRAYTLLVEAERLLVASHHRGVAYDAAVVAETLLSVSTDEADAMIRQDALIAHLELLAINLDGVSCEFIALIAVSEFIASAL